MPKKGVVIIACGRMGYGFAAVNLFYSIKKHNADMPICLIGDEQLISSLPEAIEFDEIKIVPLSYYHHNGRIDPAKMKFECYDLLAYEINLVVDADNICLQNIDKLFIDKPFAVQYVSTGGIDSSIDYMWAENKDVFDWFELPDDAQIATVQSSIMLVKKCKEVENLFKEFRNYFYKGFPKEKIKQWGGTLPDELIITGVLAKTNRNADYGFKIDFLGHRNGANIDEVKKQYYFLSLYGNGNGNTLTKLTYWEWADKIMYSIMAEKNKPFNYKMIYIKRDKHANFKQI